MGVTVGGGSLVGGKVAVGSLAVGIGSGVKGPQALDSSAIKIRLDISMYIVCFTTPISLLATS
jgi:hypothetical protein